MAGYVVRFAFYNKPLTEVDFYFAQWTFSEFVQ